MAMLAAYLPADIAEAQLAAQIVAADAHAKDCFRLAVRPGQDPDVTGRCRAQAATMIRLMQSGLRALQRTQALRQKAEAVMQPASMERAGYWFRDASVPAVADAAEAEQPEPSEPAFETLSEAEQYAVVHPARAALIRAHGGLPARLDFGPPDPAVVEGLVRGASPVLQALVPPGRQRSATAA